MHPLVEAGLLLWSAPKPVRTIAECEQELNNAQQHLAALQALDRKGWLALNTRTHNDNKEQTARDNIEIAAQRTEWQAMLSAVATLRDNLKLGSDYHSTLDELAEFLRKKIEEASDNPEPKKPSTDYFIRDQLRNAGYGVNVTRNNLAYCCAEWAAYEAAQANIARLRKMTCRR